MMHRLFAVALLTSAALTAAAVRAEPIEFPETLPGTKRLTIDEPLDQVMVSGIGRFALRELQESVERRAEKWNRDYRSPEAYAESIKENRERFRTIIGAVDERVPIRWSLPLEPQNVLMAADGINLPDRHANEESFQAIYLTWDVLDGVTAEGWLLAPHQHPKALVIALPDADWTPEMFIGWKEGVPPQAQLARRLVENGCLVLVPTLISRDDKHSGHPHVRYTNQPHREFVHRMAFQMGRHVIGYEVQKVLAAVDVFERMNQDREQKLPTGVVGVGEGGLLALYSAAVDPRIGAAMVCGYFQQREAVWEEPIYRNVWSLLTEFGDAEIASLIAPRPLIIEACGVPEVTGPPPPREGRSGAAPGRIETATLASVRLEYDRAMEHYEKLKAADRRLTFVSSGEGDGPAGTDAGLSAFLKGLKSAEAGAARAFSPPSQGGAGGGQAETRDIPRPAGRSTPPGPPLVRGGAKTPAREGVKAPDPDQRQKRQFDELVEFTQNLLRDSARVRDEFWKQADRSSVEVWKKSAEFYRNYVWDEMIGRLPEPTVPPNVRTRKVIDTPEFKGYEVVIDVYPDVIASGILLLPADLRAGERRPVVVCQHGLEGTPMDTITTEGRAFQPYQAFSAELAKRGYIVYAPQNPYRGGDAFRTLQRKSNPMKRSLFSYILPQHQRTLDWLASLPNVDAERIGFYGLSYGGKTAVRVPPLLGQYALSICSADFNEWIKKNVTNRARYSYMFTGEYEIYEWNMGHVANYAELSYLMTPRPFMVERGHHDGVAPDEWVAWEYAKVRRHYVALGLGDQTEIEWFDGPHAIHGVGTYEFLDRHLKQSDD